MQRHLFSTEDLFNLVMQTHNFHWDVEYGIYFIELLEDVYNSIFIDTALIGKPSRFKFLALVFEVSKNKGISKEVWIEFIKNILGAHYQTVIDTMSERRKNSGYT